MKRVIAVILVAAALLLCGCSNKVDQAQARLDAGDYQGAIEAADSALGSDIDEEFIDEINKIKTNAIYNQQKEAYDNGEWDESAECYRKMLLEGQEGHYFKMSQKLGLLVQAEQHLETIKSCVGESQWDDIIYEWEQIERLSNNSAFTYESGDELNLRMKEIVTEAHPVFDNAKKNKLYEDFLYSIKEGDAEAAIAAATEIHNGWPESKEDIEVQEYLPELIEQTKAEDAAEEARIEAERQEKEHKLKNIIRVERVWTSEPDFLGGVKVYINFTNTSNRTIKYVTFEIQLYNAVDDIVECEINGWVPGNSYNCKYTGPCAPGEGLAGTSKYWGQYYNSTIKYAKLVSVDIEYVNGAPVRIDGDDIDIIQY